MSESPTTVGSIIAHLKVDASNWDAKLTEAGVKSDELGRHNPTIRVDANVGEALAKIDAVALAEQRLAVAEIKQVAATNLAVAAEDRRWRIGQSLTATLMQKSAAEDAATRATEKAELAALGLTAAEDALEASQRKAAEMALAEAAAQETNTAGKVKANEANSMTITRMGLILAAVATLVPMIAPLAGYVLGVAGALTLMGGAGVAALVGIKQEMAAGTALGNQYAQGIEGLKNSLGELSHTGAVVMLDQFNRFTGELSSALPMLNRQVSEFTGLLGRTGNNLFSGAISGLHVLEPLLLSVGQYVERLSAGFMSWTRDGGLQSFANYAMATLPVVQQTLAALAGAIMHILEALAPLGEVGLTVLKAVSDVISAMPVDALTGLIAGGTAAFLAFKMWEMLIPIINGVAGAISGAALVTEAAAGPVGWLIAGISALVAIFAVSAVSANEAKQSVVSYTSALEADSGAIGENVRAQAAKALIDSGAIEAAKRLGISQATLTDATLGHKDALNLLSDVTDKTNAATSKTAGLQSRMAEAYKKAHPEITQNAADLKLVNDQVKANSDAIQVAITDGIDYNAAMHLGGTVAETMATSLGLTVDAYNKLTASQNTATAAAKTWKSELDILNGVAQSSEQAAINLSADYQNMATSITGNIKSMGVAAATSLDINTAGGLANHQLILKAVEDAQAQSEAIIKSEGGTAQAREDARVKLESSRQSIVDHMTALGLDKGAVDNLVGSLLTVPAHIKTELEVAAQAAQTTVEDLQAQLDRIPRAISIMMTTTQQTNYITGNQGVLKHGSTGLTVPGMATGGTPGGSVVGPGDAYSDTAGLYHLANGEEVISNRMGQAARNRPLLKAINAGTLTAMPGMMAGSVRSSSFASAPTQGGQASERPIYMDGSLFGVLKTLANGQAQIVWNTGIDKMAVQYAGGVS